MGLDEVEAGDVAEVTVVGGEGALANEGGGGDPGVGGGERATHAFEVGAQAGGDCDKVGLRPRPYNLVPADVLVQPQLSGFTPAAALHPKQKFFEGLK